MAQRRSLPAQSRGANGVIFVAKLLYGIVPPVITPLHGPENLDAAALQRVIARVLDAGVQGIFLLGSTGEFASLTMDARRAVIDEGCLHTDARVPVVVNVSHTCLAESRELAGHAARAGASALAVCPPYYFPLNQLELLHYIRRFSESVSLPVFLYNIPQYARTEFEAETVCALAELPNVAGVKNSNGSVAYVQTVRRGTAHRPDFSILIGTEEDLLPAMDAGADGGVCGGANLFPDLFVKLYRAISEARRPDAERLQSLITRIAKDLYTVGPLNSAYLRGLKGALALLGVAGDSMADPLEAFDDKQKYELADRLRRLLPDINDQILSLEQGADV
jgi:dihydrodipicolinate synthase/N-acetylneuraminate lyase